MYKNVMDLIAEEKIYPIVRNNDAQKAVDIAHALIEGGIKVLEITIENPSFAALIVGKIARASECNVKFILNEGSCLKNSHITLPSEALVTITGNLIDNALDSMNMDSTKKDKELSLGVYSRPNELLIIVKDTGTGIEEELKDKIFEKGFSTKGEGRGIGLYHTKQLITSLGGRISVESEVGIGSCFMVNL